VLYGRAYSQMDLPNPGLRRAEAAPAWPFPKEAGPSYTTPLPTASPAVWHSNVGEPLSGARRLRGSRLSFPWAEKDFVHHALAYSQSFALAEEPEPSVFSLDRPPTSLSPQRGEDRRGVCSFFSGCPRVEVTPSRSGKGPGVR
jgi:hypothetical protein